MQTDIKYGDYVQMMDRFETVHIWSEELEKINANRFKPIKITKEEYDKEKAHPWNQPSPEPIPDKTVLKGCMNCGKPGCITITLISPSKTEREIKVSKCDECGHQADFEDYYKFV